MDVELKQLSPGNGIDEYDMLQDIDENEFGFSNDAKGLSYDEYKDWLIRQDDYSRNLNLPENWVPVTTFFLYVDPKPVGLGRIRHHSSEFLERSGVGNLGYGIARSARGKGYGNLLFMRLLMECKKMGYRKIRLFPYIDNVATNRIMMNNGAIPIGRLNDQKMIYEIPIE